MTSAVDPALVARLAQHRTLGGAPVHEREWLAAHGTMRTVPVGEILTHKGELSQSMYVVFAGHFVIRVDRGAGSHKIFEWRAGDVGGVLPFSRGARPPNDVVVEEETEILSIPSDCFPELIRDCPGITTTLVHQMLDRARMFNAADLRDEKLVSLGRLAAGLAHELNNPASAAVRSARRLTESVAAADQAAVALGAAGLSHDQFAAVNEVRRMCAEHDGNTNLLSAIQRADHEDEVTDWLVQHDASEDCATPLADAGVPIAALDTLAEQMSGKVLDSALCWIAATTVVSSLSGEIETAAVRMHELVDSVKRFTFMDHAPTPEPVDIRRGISDTFMMLGGKIREKGAEVVLDLPDDLPRANAVGAELNQVWMNLIDNALDALEHGGKLTLTAARELDKVVVKISDNGAGIPPEIMGRIFDPFFTTKGVGKGTGMGLETVRRILRRHEAEIDVESRPGRTEFRVSLPLEK